MEFLKRMMGWASAGWFIFLFILIAPIALPLAGICYLLAVIFQRMGGRMKVWGQRLQALAKELE